MLLRVNHKEGYIDKKTGEQSPGSAQIQLLCNKVQRDDSLVSDMTVLSLKDPSLFSLYESLIGQVIRVPAGWMNTERGTVTFWAMKGRKPEVVSPSYVQSKPTNATTPSSAVKSPLGGA
jgi:hypothetical protein